jgi:hypothetical protein
MANTILVTVVLLLLCIAAFLFGVPRQLLFAGIVIAITLGVYFSIRTGRLK